MAEELIEVGSSRRFLAQAPVLTIPEGTPNIFLTRGEADLFLRFIDGIVQFATDNPLEFFTYCSPEEFETALKRLADAEASARGQIAEGRQTVVVPASAVTSLMDVEECVSAAKSKRVDNVRLALMSSVAGGVLAWLTGFSPLAAISSVVSVGILVAKPFAEAAGPEGPGEFRQDVRMSGSGSGGPKVPFLERVIVPARPGSVYRHHWGDVVVGSGPRETEDCLVGPKYSIRVESLAGSVVRPQPPWSFGRCPSRARVAAVWTDCERTSTARDSVLALEGADVFWVRYGGPKTEGDVRIAGPFCCRDDAALHAEEDGGAGGAFEISTARPPSCPIRGTRKAGARL